MNLAEWHASGRHVRVGEHELFVRTQGSTGPWLTLLHGFPSSSWDYAKLVPLLDGYRILAFDFLGFGASAKPASHVYSIFEQADFVNQLWQDHQIAETTIVTHDYGDTVTGELLARSREGKLAAKLARVVAMNGSIYGDLNKLLIIQKLLRVRGVGAVITRLITEGAFRSNFRRVFGPAGMPTDDEFHQHWQAITLNQGHRRYHRLVWFYTEIERHHARWEAELETSPVPRHFVWGLQDPVSIPAMFERIRDRATGATFAPLEAVGHYPHLEAPELVAAEIRRQAS
jgi:pimeloyl-ACP methyl ester carboxylesterase